MTSQHTEKLPLTGQQFLITRPEEKAMDLARLIQDEGGRSIVLPVLEVEAISPQPSLGMRAYDYVIVSSVYAVTYGINIFSSIARQPTTRCFAIGPATAAALAGHHIQAEIGEAPHRSESLLAHPAFHQPAQKRILLIKGAGGRSHLFKTLSARGAQIETCSVYRRKQAQLDALPEQLAATDCFISTSGEVLQAIHHLLVVEHQQKWLLNCPFVVNSTRQIKLAQRLGFRKPPFVTHSAANQAILESLLAWSFSDGRTTA